MIEMDGCGFSDFTTLQSHMSQSGADTVINTHANDNHHTEARRMTTLTASDFVFH